MTSRDQSLPARFAESMRFLGSWIVRPSITGAVSPSGPALSRLMASHADPDDERPILELGPGTGPVTKALIERGVKPSRIVAVEYNPDFCKLLRERYPGVRVIEGDAYDLDRTLAGVDGGPFSVVISSLPLIVRKPEDRAALIDKALGLAGGGPVIQFSYSLFPPAAPVPGRFTTSPSHWVLANIPPARVWTYRRA